MALGESETQAERLSRLIRELRAELGQGSNWLREPDTELQESEPAGIEAAPASRPDSVTDAVRRANESWRQRRQESLFLQITRRRLRR